ncbi:MAG TPA: 2-oxo acid dehydrogenase subunit E2 [Bacillota bacterium]|jgi:pyruvate dehydrogenase E2 component (dihydrolipoamide acetyltransferase)
MPKLGLTMIQGKVVKWLVAEGDSVTKGQTIVQVTTEKIANVVEAPADGVVRKILVAQGATVPVLTPLAIIGSAGEDISEALKAASTAPAVSNIVAGASAPIAAAKTAAAPAGPAAQPVYPAPAGDSLKVSPIARKLAEEAGLDLSTVVGSGPAGRILREDVEKALAAKKTGPSAMNTAPAVAAATPNAGPVKASPAARKLAEEKGLDLSLIQGTGPDGRILTEDVERAAATTNLPSADQTVPASDMRMVIARRMMESMTVAAQTTISRSVNVGELVRLRESLVPRLAREGGVKLTYTDLIVRAVALSLRRHPEINVSFDGQNVTTHAEINLGIAVDLGDGLIVPVVHRADTLGLSQLSARIKGLAEMARRGALEPDDVVGNTLTVTNLGMFGIDVFTPIINQPESVILGVGRIADRPVVENGQVVPGKEMVLSLTHDHRVIDGATAARFLNTVVGYLEAPYTLLGLGNGL